MSPETFAICQRNLGVTDIQLANALGTHPSVIQNLKKGNFKVGGPTILCLQMLLEMDPEQRKRYLY